jgi:hypothetical protein
VGTMQDRLRSRFDIEEVAPEGNLTSPQ